MGGEQTQTQTHAHTHLQTLLQTQSHPRVQPPTQPHQDSAAAPQTQTSAELANVPLQTAPPPSKIPLRPRKIRKLSPETAVEPNSSDNSNAGTIPSKPTSRATKAKTNTPRAIVVPRFAARSLSCEGEFEIAIRHLRDADPLLASLIDIHPPPTFDSFHTPFLALTRSILYQQLAFKAGTSIYTRFIALCGGEAGVLPDTVLALTPQQLRQIGVSGRKASYLHDLAKKYKNGILSDSAILNMDDKSLFTMLTMVNGIGSWSVHMFMIFSLHRPDVLPINDLGVRKGVQLLYNLEELPRPSQMDQLCEKWRPYRSVASWYLWRFVEAKGAPSSAAAVAAAAGMQLQQQDEHQHQQQPQLIDPINSILNLGINLTCDLREKQDWIIGTTMEDNYLLTRNVLEDA
ncbi:putative DNA-3-methyladenine glycosylase [Tripterygium wilfordii]|uniref:Putative DNA-3-methyladenine glycosylase n=1 Tax=Tripterygium wilfordii TaxID=458696 RepID=A0A7J7CZI0_TRIWF|nr:DNA-3-methyladenine glycosylase isoform X2 [Tripterygium wilfordii]KAF5739379.1 putative DNA-3-methyladenine glycosylase [Tripterygium wilfordii]